MIQTAKNTPTPIVTPSEQDTLARLVLAAERAAAALEVLAEDVKRQAPPKPLLAPRAHVATPRVDDLFLCAACGLGEGELTTECPGWRVPAAFGAEVYVGRADFVGGQWVAGATKEAAARSGPCAPACDPSDMRASDDGRQNVCAKCSSRFPVNAARPNPTPAQVAEVRARLETPNTSRGASASALAPGAQEAGPGPVAAPAPITPATTPATGAAPVAGVPQQLAESLNEREVFARGLSGDLVLADRVATIRDETQDGPLATAVKQVALARLGEAGFVALRGRLKIVPGAIPTGAQLRAVARALAEPVAAAASTESDPWA